MKILLSALVAGMLFGLGLGISGMGQADKVIGFLDLADAWDPSLAFVMGGAIAIHLVVYRFVLQLPSPLYSATFGIPTRTDIDPRLLGGAALFGVGWAVGGYCPGPGMLAASSAAPQGLVFLLFLSLGMAIVQAFEAHRTVDASARG